MEIILKEHGIVAGCSDLNAKLNALLDTLDSKQSYTLIFDGGEYHLPVETAVSKVAYMTNTMGINEMNPPNRKIGIELVNRHNITLDGRGSSLIYYGRMTEFVLTKCTNIGIINFNVDFHKATVAEFTVTKVDGNDVTFIPCPDSEWEIVGGKFAFKALDKISRGVVIQECDVAAQLTRRVDSMTSWQGCFLDKQTTSSDNGDGSITCTLPPTHAFRQGMVYQFCRILRDACGTFIDNCRDVRLEGNNYYFIHGMGILAQCSHNISIIKCNIEPNRAKGRTTATFADMIHCSMCSGDVIVDGCRFDGARDDIINVHGNHFVISKACGNVIEMKYKHPQAYGFNAFLPGEEVEVIHNKYLTPLAKYKVLTAELIDLFTIRITVEGTIDSKLCKKGRLIENLTRQVNLTYTNNIAYNIPTRGMLITTHGKVVVANNTFHKMYMSAILISDDGTSWFESGYVRDVLIENNRFIDCCTWVIDVLPEAHTKIKRPIVHKNIRVIGNYIKIADSKLVRVRRTDGFVFQSNTIEGLDNYQIESRDNTNCKIDIAK